MDATITTTFRVFRRFRNINPSFVRFYSCRGVQSMSVLVNKAFGCVTVAIATQGASTRMKPPGDYVIKSPLRLTGNPYTIFHPENPLILSRYLKQWLKPTEAHF